MDVGRRRTRLLGCHSELTWASAGSYQGEDAAMVDGGKGKLYRFNILLSSCYH